VERGRREIPEEEKKEGGEREREGGASKKREDEGEQRDPRSLYSRLLGDGELVGVGQGSSKALLLPRTSGTRAFLDNP